MSHRTSIHVRALAIAAALAIPAAGAASIALSSAASAQVFTGTFTGLSVSAIEGQSKDFHVASVFAEMLSNISVDWGDKSATSTGSTDGTQVHATHTYAEAGTYTITVTADALVIPMGPPGLPGPLDTVPVSTTSTATISDDVVNLHGEQSVVLPGGAFDGTVADGNDHNDAGSLSDFSAVIDWGDGSAPQTCTSCITDNGDGDFDVDATHQYTAAGIYQVQTMVEDDGSDVREVPVRTTVVVPIMATTLSGVNEGTEFSGTVGSIIAAHGFEDVARPAVATPVYNTVTIDWGDGSDTSSGVVGDDGTVSGTHTYADEGTYTITLDGSVVHPAIPQQSQSSATSTVTVGDAPLTGTPSDSSPFTATQGTALSGVFGSVVDGNAGGPASDLSATIDWGDGSSSAATLVAGAGSAVAAKVAGTGYNASGSHTYTATGTKNGVVHFVDKGGATANVPFTVNVAASQVQGITSNPSGGNPTGGTPVLSTPNTGADLPIATAALLIAAGGSLFAVGRRRRS